MVSGAIGRSETAILRSLVMSDETKKNENKEIKDEQLEDVAGGFIKPVNDPDNLKDETAGPRSKTVGDFGRE